jgi:hypothetical protein
MSSSLCTQRQPINPLVRVELLQKGLDGTGVATQVLSDLVTILEDNECGHGANAELLCKLGDSVDVELGEVDLVLEFLGLSPPVGKEC